LKAVENEKKFYHTLLLLISLAVLSVVIIFAISWLYRKNQKEKQKKIAKLEESLSSVKQQRSAVQEELRKLKEKDYDGMIAEKEKQEAELSQAIERLQAENDRFKHRQDHLESFLESSIAQLFIKKANGKAERPVPSEAEWKLLMSQFSKDIPVTFKSFGEGKSLSPLEQRICVLLILDIPEKTISMMTESVGSTVSNAKARANEKLYGKKDAPSLKNNLIHALRRS
jgi:DNA repair exonuclease SbcCD ATPase subunit